MLHFALETVYVLLVVGLLALVAAAGRAIGRLRARLSTQQRRLMRHQAALEALGELALARGATVAQIRAVVGPHLQVADQRPGATVLMTSIPSSQRRHFAPGVAAVPREDTR